MRFIYAIALSASLSVPAAAFADTISVYSTGIAGAGVVDPNYTIVSGPAGLTGSAYGVPNCDATSGCQAAYYQPTVGLYINPTGVGTDSQPSTPDYVYQTTFTLLPGEDASTAVLNIVLAADDTATVLLNGSNVFMGGTYGTATDFTISAGFVTGVNTLDFDVVNSGGGPTGLYAGVTGTVSPTPEPSSLVLLGTGILGLAGAARRKLRS